MRIATRNSYRCSAEPSTGVPDFATQSRKLLFLCLAGLRFRWFDPIAEPSELPNHSRSALLLGLLGDGWAPFFVTNSLVQDQPDQSTLSMGMAPMA